MVAQGPATFQSCAKPFHRFFSAELPVPSMLQYFQQVTYACSGKHHLVHSVHCGLMGTELVNEPSVARPAFREAKIQQMEIANDVE
jgi:hypothetical protein